MNAGRSTRHRDVLAAVAMGAVIGSEARYLLSRAWPDSPGEFPWTTLLINGTGCLLIGVLMVVITELATAHPLVRPMLGVGVLGGYTTFSAYSEQTRALLDGGHLGLALTYLWLTPVAALVAVWTGAVSTRAAARYRRMQGGS